MKNNFASYELTKLLPKNENKLDYAWYELTPQQLSGTKIPAYIELRNTHIRFSPLRFEKEELLCPAWTWEDIRLYLHTKGYHINYLINEECTYFEYEILSTTNVSDAWYEESNKGFTSYEEAREAAIKHCLYMVDEEPIDIDKIIYKPVTLKKPIKSNENYEEFKNSVGIIEGYTFDDTTEFLDVRWSEGFRYSYTLDELHIVSFEDAHFHLAKLIKQNKLTYNYEDSNSEK